MTQPKARVVLPRNTSGYDQLVLRSGSLSQLGRFQSRSAPDAPPLPLNLLSKTDLDESGAVLARASCPYLSTRVLCLRDETIAPLSALLAPYGQLLAADCAEAEIVIFNATTLVPVVDLEASDVLRLDGREILSIKHFVLRADAELPPVFKTAEWPASPVCFRSDFAEQLLHATHVTGTRFAPLP